MHITLGGYTVPVRDLEHGERLQEIADRLRSEDYDKFESWAADGCPEDEAGLAADAAIGMSMKQAIDRRYQVAVVDADGDIVDVFHYTDDLDDARAVAAGDEHTLGGQVWDTLEGRWETGQ